MMFVCHKLVRANLSEFYHGIFIHSNVILCMYMYMLCVTHATRAQWALCN